MKRLLLLAVAAFLVSGVSFAQDGTSVKTKKEATHPGKNCEKPVKIKKAK